MKHDDFPLEKTNVWEQVFSNTMWQHLLYGVRNTESEQVLPSQVSGMDLRNVKHKWTNALLLWHKQ